MNGYLLVNKLKKEFVEDYSKTHENVHNSQWKDLLNAIKEAGFENMQVFVYDDFSLVHCQCDDLNAAFEKLSHCEINEKWQKLMGTFFAENPKFDGETIPVTKVFDLHEQLNGYLNN